MAEPRVIPGAAEGTIGALKAALAYAGRGWRVIPIHTPGPDGACSCARATACDAIAKHPRLAGWPEAATTGPAVIRGWWARWPTANVGVVTGSASGLLALDVDPRAGGDEALALLEAHHGPLPRTVRQRTGGGGEHILFRHPGATLPSRAAVLGPGLDVKAEGGFIVAPPSQHASGREYTWDAEHHPGDVPLAEVPAWLLACLRSGTRAPNGGRAPEITETIHAGTRNGLLTSLAGSMRRRGMTAEEIEAALRVVNARRCVPPLEECEVGAIAASVARYPKAPPPGAERDPGAPWRAAVAAPDFLRADDAGPAFLEDRLLAPGSITEWFSPRGLGKTHVAHALAVKHARAGRGVLLLDRDNSRRELRRRLRAWGAGEAPTLKVLARDQAPPLTDTAAWRAFPFGDYDLVVIDSIDASTEGVGEKDSAKPSRALAQILDIARRDGGPAILVLGNTVKTAEHSRGSGVVEDRADIVYEVRDATDLQPTGAKPWWQDLPQQGAGAWGERATRRKRRDTYRLGFIPSKFRVGEEPDPFILEMNLAAEPWVLRDVTAEVEAAGEAARLEAEAAHHLQLNHATAALTQEIQRREAAGASPLKSEDAERRLRDFKLTRAEARRLLRDVDGAAWRRERFPGRGQPLVLRAVGISKPSAAEIPGEESSHQERASETSNPAERTDTRRRKSAVTDPASIAAVRAEAFPPPSQEMLGTPLDGEGGRAPAPRHSEACDCLACTPAAPDEVEL